MRTALLTALLAGVAPLATGCFPEVGECDPVLAERVVFDSTTGAPAFEGQSMMISSCASGFCHADVEDPGARKGVPDGLMFDVQLAATDASANEDEVVRQRHARFRIVQEARNILYALDSGAMPPPGPEGDAYLEGAPVYTDVDGERVRPPRTAEGREILRNWLACGAPVVERSVPHPDGIPAVVRGGRPAVSLEPTWSSIFDGLIVARCGSSLCHGGDRDAGFQIATDRDGEPDAAGTYANLMAEASGEDCGGEGRRLLVPNDPGASLFYTKLAGDPDCGAPMPDDGTAVLGPDNLAAVEAWIAAGATP